MINLMPQRNLSGELKSMKLFKTILITCIALLASRTMVNAQNNPDVTLTVLGTGVNKEEAVTNALRSAIEQAYGVFVSSDLTILNDEVVRNEIATISKGNIKSYKELSVSLLPNNNYSVTLSAVVSTDKLINYAKANNFRIEFAGGVFGQRLKILELNEKNEKIAIDNMVHQLNLIIPHMFYFKVDSLETPRTDRNSNYYIPARLRIYANDYNVEFNNVFFGTLKSLSLTENERHEYEQMNREYYEYDFGTERQNQYDYTYNVRGETQKIYLRNKYISYYYSGDAIKVFDIIFSKLNSAAVDVNMIANLSDGTVMKANISFNTNTFELQRLGRKNTPNVYFETYSEWRSLNSPNPVYICEPSFLFSVQGGKLLFERRILIGLFLESDLSKIAGFELKSENHSMSENCSKSANNPKSKKKRK